MVGPACVRLLSNPTVTPESLTATEALQVLTANLQHSGHVFWPDDLDFPSATSLCGAKLQGQRQANDAYLLGLALHCKAHVVTLDSGIVSLMPSSPRPATRVIDLPATPRRH